MIATHNRVSELVKTLASCRAQTWPHKEVLVVDDASSDGTYETVRAHFPEVNIVRRETNAGSIAARNDILRRAQGKYIIALDDDSRLVDNDACEKIVARMEAEPDLGIISLLVIGPENPAREVELEQAAGNWHCSSYAACGAVLRGSMLEKTGPFEELFFHSYEEPDMCLRAWDAGYRVWQWNEIVVYHEFSLLNRNERRTHFRHARNEACGIAMRFPWPLVVPATLARLANQARYAARRGWLRYEPTVWGAYLLLLPRALKARRAVSPRAVKLTLALNRQRVFDPQAVWKLGELSYRQILSRKTTTSQIVPASASIPPHCETPIAR